MNALNTLNTVLIDVSALDHSAADAIYKMWLRSSTFSLASRLSCSINGWLIKPAG